MASSVNGSGVASQHKRLEDVDLRMAKVDLNNVEIWKRRSGEAIDYAISLSNRTNKEVWVELGHDGGAQLSRWIAGTENASFGALFSIPWLRQPLVIALASLVEGIETETTLRIVRRIG